MNPVLFELGAIKIYSYGLFVAIGFFITSLLVARDGDQYSIPKEKIWDLLLWILISGIIGARLLHVVLNLKYYNGSYVDILMMQKGGLAIHGGIAASLIAARIFVARNHLSFRKAGDLVMQYMPLGQAIGRIGCIFNGCCFGRGIHPAQTYTILLLLCIHGILRFMARFRKTEDGRIFLGYFLLYPFARFVIDFSRGDLKVIAFGLTMSQFISLTFFIAAGITYLIISKKSYE